MQTPTLGGEGPRKTPKVSHITPGQASRFLTKPVEPFCSGSAHPLGGARESASQKIDCSSDTGRNRNAQAPIMHGEPFLLLGTAKGHEKQIRMRFANAPA